MAFLEFSPFSKKTNSDHECPEGTTLFGGKDSLHGRACGDWWQTAIAYCTKVANDSSSWFVREHFSPMCSFYWNQFSDRFRCVWMQRESFFGHEKVFSFLRIFVYKCTTHTFSTFETVELVVAFWRPYQRLVVAYQVIYATIGEACRCATSHKKNHARAKKMCARKKKTPLGIPEHTTINQK